MTTLVVVIGASTVIEAAVAGLYAVVGIVTGGLVRAVVFSLPNALGAADRPGGATVLSATLDSDAISVMAGCCSRRAKPI